MKMFIDSEVCKHYLSLVGFLFGLSLVNGVHHRMYMYKFNQIYHDLELYLCLILITLGFLVHNTAEFVLYLSGYTLGYLIAVPPPLINFWKIFHTPALIPTPRS